MSEVRYPDNVPPAVKDMAETLRKLHPNGGYETAQDFEPEATDVLVCSGPKCGTTWVQQIVHSLRSRGDMNFEEIIEVMPNVEFAPDPAYPSVDTPQPFYPRAFKTHLRWDLLSKGPFKRIVVTRNPHDAAVSLYYFCGNLFFDMNELTLHEFVEWMIIRQLPPSICTTNAAQLRHLASWYPHRKDENVLWLHFEDLKEDLPKCIDMISEFLKIGVGDEELLQLVADQASFEFMKKHQSKYSIETVKRRARERQGLLVQAWTANNPGKVRSGKTNEGSRLLSDEMKKKLDAKWKELIEPVSGYASYEAMRAGINKELGRSFGTA